MEIFKKIFNQYFEMKKTAFFLIFLVFPLFSSLQAVQDKSAGNQASPSRAEILSKKYFREGMDFFQKNDWPAAAGFFEKSVQENPGFAAGYEAWGRAKLYAGNLDHALELSQKAVSLNPGLAEAYANLAAIYQKRGVWLKGLDAGKKAIELNPNLARAHYHLGLLYFEQGLPEEAVKEYTKVVELAPNFSHIHLDLGRAYGAVDYPDLEMQEYQKAVEESPDKAAAHRYLAFAHYRKKDYAAALRECLNSLQKDPRHDETYFYLGNIYREMQQPAKALAAYRKAVSLNPESMEAHRALAPLAIRRRQVFTAIHSYGKILKASPENFKDYPDLAYAYQLAGWTDKAIETWKQVFAQETPPNDLDVVYFNLGMLYRNKKEWDKAIEAYKKAIELQPKQPDYHVALSVAYCAKGLAKPAMDEYRQGFALKAPNILNLFKYLEATCPENPQAGKKTPDLKTRLEQAKTRES